MRVKAEGGCPGLKEHISSSHPSHSKHSPEAYVPVPVAHSVQRACQINAGRRGMVVKGSSAPWLCVLACDDLSPFPHWTLSRMKVGPWIALLVSLGALILPHIESGLCARPRQVSACSFPSTP